MVAERVQRRALPVYAVPSEVHRMMDACDTERDRVLVELLFNTGARISEALSVRAGDITKRGVRLPNLKQGGWHKNEDGSKGKHFTIQAEKHVILHPDFMLRLREYVRGMRQTDSLFGRHSDGKAICRRMAWLIITRAAARAGVLKKRFGDEELRPAWPHSLRHSYAVHLVDNGIPLPVVSEQLGHSSLSSTQVYVKLSNARTAELISGISF